MTKEIQPYFYRTHHGAEVDLVLVNGPKALAAIEIKFSSSPSVKDGYFESIKDLGTRHHYIIYPGNDEFFTRGKIKAVPLANFLTKYLPKIKY